MNENFTRKTKLAFREDLFLRIKAFQKFRLAKICTLRVLPIHFVNNTYLNIDNDNFLWWFHLIHLSITKNCKRFLSTKCPYNQENLLRFINKTT